MEPGKANSSRKMAVNKIHNTRFRGEANTNRKRKVINNGSNKMKRVCKESESIVTTETGSIVTTESKGDDGKCCQVVKKQDERNISLVDGCEKLVDDSSKKDISRLQTSEKADCERKPSETPVVKPKLKLNDSAQVDGSEKVVPTEDSSKKGISHVKTSEKAICDRKPSETCVVKPKLKLDDNAEVDGSEKVVPAEDSSKKDISHDQTVEKADCERKPSETCVVKEKLKLNDSAEVDEKEKIAKHTTIVKMQVDGHERAMYRCDYCNKWKTSAALASNMLAHLAKHETGELRCSRCGHDAVNVPALEEHVARVHTHEAQFVCALCGKACFSRKQLRQHEDIHNLHPRHCRHCGQTVRSLAQLKKHTKMEHGGDGLYSCDECHKTFVFKTWFEAHKARGACGLRATCSLCGAVVVKGGGMSAHMRRVHAGEKRELCSYCPFTAFTKTQVRLHERTHTRDHPFTCHLCTFSAAKKYQLTSHMRTHTGEKPFHCDQCPFASSWKVQLRAHQVAHTSASAVSCDACGVVCRDPGSLGVHRQREHGRAGGNRKSAKTPAGCETRSAVASVVDVITAGECQPHSEVEQMAAGSDEVTSYIIVNEAVAKDIERLGLETVALVLLDDTTGGATVTTQNPSSGEATQHVEVAHIISDVTMETTEKEHPSLDVAVEVCGRKNNVTASKTFEKLGEMNTISETTNC